jgi:20S proteasome subunit beta 7
MHPMKNLATPLTHTTSPTITGGTVIGLKYNGGVLLAADTSLNYGAYHIEKNESRIHKVSDNTALASGGEFADFTNLVK